MVLRELLSKTHRPAGRIPHRHLQVSRQKARNHQRTPQNETPITTQSSLVRSPKRSFTLNQYINNWKALINSHGELVTGLLLLLCSLTFYYFSVLRIDYEKTSLLDLGPYPDATEYFGQARALEREGRPYIQIGLDKLPSRYPVGYPILMLPWLKVLPEAKAVLAPFRTNQSIGLLLILAVFTTYAYVGVPLSGGIGALLLVTLPAFFTFCRSSLSEVSGSALVALAFVFAYLGLRANRRWPIYAASILLGLSFNIRTALVFFGPLLLAMALLPRTRSPIGWLFHCASAVIVFAIAASPFFVLNTLQFHHPFNTGHHFWAGKPIEMSMVFSPRNIPNHLTTIWNEFSLQWQHYRPANIFGTGTHFVPPFALLVVIGLPFIRRDRFAICALLAALTFCTAATMYVFADLRFYVPILFLSVAVAVLPVEWALRQIRAARKHWLAVVVILVLAVAACVGYPSQSGYKPKKGRFQAWDALSFDKQGQQSLQFFAAQELIKRVGNEPGNVFSDIDPVYLNALLPNQFVAAPLDANHNYRYSRIWHYGASEAIKLIGNGLGSSRPNYSLFAPVKGRAPDYARLPLVEGYKWLPIDGSDNNVIIMKLTQAPVE